MKTIITVLMSSVLLSMPVRADENQDVIEEHSQEYYDEQIVGSMKELTTQLQTMSGEIIKYMNAMNKALNESVPQISSDMGKMISSVKPLADTMQKNVENFAKEIDAQLDLSDNNDFSDTDLTEASAADENVISPEKIIVPVSEDISAAVDEELAQFAPPPSTAPKAKIKLFPSSVE